MLVLHLVQEVMGVRPNAVDKLHVGDGLHMPVLIMLPRKAQPVGLQRASHRPPYMPMTHTSAAAMHSQSPPASSKP